MLERPHDWVGTVISRRAPSLGVGRRNRPSSAKIRSSSTSAARFSFSAAPRAACDPRFCVPARGRPAGRPCSLQRSFCSKSAHEHDDEIAVNCGAGRPLILRIDDLRDKHTVDCLVCASARSAGCHPDLYREGHERPRASRSSDCGWRPNERLGKPTSDRRGQGDRDHS
jgi:hypothetical protein